MVVSYKRANTEGLTGRDMIEAISNIYGDPVGSTTEILLPSIYDDSEIVETTADWQNPDWSLHLVRSKYQPAFYLVALSEQRYAPARAAISEAIRMDREHTPLRETERLQENEEQRRLQDDRSRTDDRPGFALEAPPSEANSLAPAPAPTARPRRPIRRRRNWRPPASSRR